MGERPRIGSWQYARDNPERIVVTVDRNRDGAHFVARRGGDRLGEFDDHHSAVSLAQRCPRARTPQPTPER